MNLMLYRKSILGFGRTITAIILLGMATVNFLNAQAQSADTSQQIRDYLIQAIQALDNGDNSEAIRQLQLATDQIGTFTTISEQSSGRESNESNNGNGGSDDEGEESEEGSGEDEDEPGDTDTNDEED
jgi:hypothetical protein